MTLYADDPDVHVVFPVTDREGQNITISPATVMVDGFSDITATWLGDPAPVRNLKVPLYGLPPMVELKLRLVVPGDNDVPLTAKTGGVILRASSDDWEWSGQPGGTDLGSIGSALTISAPGSYELDLTANATVTVSTSGDVTLWVHGTGQTLTVAGQAFTIDDDAVILIVTSPREVQSAYLAGGSSVEVDPGGPVADPPTQPGAITVDPTSDGYNLSWIASTVAAGYEVQIDGGAWLDSGANLTHAYTGLAAGSSHSGAVRAYNSLGAKSTARAWGPASVDTVGLHEQLLALNAPVYLRFTNGTMEDFGNAGITWSQSGFTPAADLDGGPGLAPGDASSARFPNGAGLRTTNLQGAFTNKTAITVIALVHTIDGADGGTRLFQVPALGAFGMSVGSFNEAVSAGSTHLLVGTWKDGETGVQWRDGVAVNVDGFSWTNGAPTTDPDAKEAWMFRNREFGSFNSGTDLAYLVALPGTNPLTEAQIMALTVAAGTVGNPR